jgi:hypothetical protein
MLMREILLEIQHMLVPEQCGSFLTCAECKKNSDWKCNQGAELVIHHDVGRCDCTTRFQFHSKSQLLKD